MHEKLLQEFRRHVSGRSRLGQTASAAFEPHLWSAIANSETLASVECVSVEDVQMAVSIAADHGLNVSALGGGHDWVGRSVCRDGVTLDLRPLDQASFDGMRKMVIAGGGALAGTAVDCLPQDEVVVTGVSRGVGLTGLALGGGYGKLNSRFGLVTDTVLRFNVVLADGRLVVASEDEHPDLFWAMRGAGKNFGIVTSAEYRTFSLPKVLTGKVFFPISNSKAGMRILQEALDDETEYLSVFANFLDVPDLGFGLVLEPLWTGEMGKGERVLEKLRASEGAVLLQQDRKHYVEVFDDSDGSAKGEAYKMDALNVPRLSEEFIDAVVEIASTSPSLGNTIMFHDLRGAAAKALPDATAFPLRENHFNVQVVAAWNPEEDAGRLGAEAWLEQFQFRLMPFSHGGAYPAVLGPDSAPRARDFYGASLAEIQTLKAKYDPYNRFSAEFGLDGTRER